MRFQLTFGTSHPLPPFLEGGGKSAPPRITREPKKPGINRVKGHCPQQSENKIMTLSKSLKEIIWPFLTKFVLGTLMKTGCQRELVPKGKEATLRLKPIFRLVFASFLSSHIFLFYQVFLFKKSKRQLCVWSQYFFSFTSGLCFLPGFLPYISFLIMFFLFFLNWMSDLF